MSGIYIPGVSVPADDTILLRVYPEENGYYFVERIDGIDQDFLGSYWAVPIPPHGRLINEKDIFDKILPFIETPYCYNRLQVISETLVKCLQIVRDVPTVIPAEGGE